MIKSLVKVDVEKQDDVNKIIEKDIKKGFSVSEDGEKRLFTAVVLRPNQVDAHGDIYDYETVEKACHEYTAYCMNQNLQHIVDVEKEQVQVVESGIARSDYELGEGAVLEGDWVMTVKVLDDDIWDACKEGTFKAFSIGCTTHVIKVEDQ